MVMLPAAPFPQPTLSFPAPSLSPTFGLTEDDARFITQVPTLSPPNLIVPPTTNPVNTAALSTAVGLDTDPTGWTPQEAAAQTDRALARIGAVNPEMAQDLAARRQGDAAVADEDGGFLADAWNAVTGAVGDVVGGALDLMDRASHIVPEVLYDTDESVWKNIGDALSGNSDTRWRDVLEDKWGLHRSWMTQVLGFVGDVVTDPLTYTPLGAGGIAKTATAKALATTSVKAFLEGGSEAGSILLKDMIERGVATTADGAAQFLMRTGTAGDVIAKEAQRSLGGRIRALAGRAHPDAAPGLAFSMAQQAEEAAFKQAIQIGTDAYRIGTGAGFSHTTKEAFRAITGLEKDVVEEALRGTIRAGSGIGVKREAYEAGKIASGVLGGVRIQLPVPMLGFRFQTGGSRLLAATQRADFQIARRFFAGASGEVRLSRMVGQGKASVNELRAFWEEGFSGVKTMSEGLGTTTYRELSRGAMHLGSIAYPLSEAVGDFTAHLTPSAALLRGGGLAIKAASDARRVATHITQQVEEGVRTILKPDGRLSNFKETDEFLVKVWSGVPEEGRGAYFGELDEFIVTRAAGQEAGQTAEQFYMPRIRDAEQNQQVALAADLRRAMERAKAAEQAIAKRGGDHLEAARQFHAININRRNEYLSIGGGTDVIDKNLAEADELREADALRLIEGNHELAARTDFMASQPERALNGVGPRMLADADAEGVNVVRGAHFFAPSPEFAAEAAAERLGRVPIASNEADELVRDLTGGGGGGMFAIEVPEGSLGAKVRDNVAAARGEAAVDVRVTYDDLVKGLADEEAAQVGRALQDLRARKATVGGGLAVTPESNYAMQLRNPYVRDLTGAGEAATQVVDEIGDLERQFDAVLKRAKEQLGTTVDEVDLSTVTDERVKRIIRDELDGTAEKAEYVRRQLRKRGHDGIITKTEKGTYATVLMDETGVIPAARLSAKAPHVGVSTMPAPRVATQSVQAAVSKMPQLRELPGGGDGWLREVLRDTARMSVPEAEEHITTELRKRGVGLLPGQRVLETDPYAVARGISSQTGRDVRDAFLNRVAARIDNVGLASTVWRGGPSGTSPFRFTINEGRFEAAKKYLGKLAKAEERLARFQADGGSDVLNERATVLAQQMQDVERMVADEVRTLQEAARSDAAPALWTEEDVIRKLGDYDSLFRQARDRGIIGAVRAEGQDGWFQLSDNMVQWRKGGKDTYFWVEDGRVLSVREVSDASAIAKQLVAQGKLSAKRLPFTREIKAWTAPSARGGGRASRLLDQDWADRGIDTLEKASEAISAQTFSVSGAELNVSKLNRMKDTFVEQARKSIDAEQREVKKRLADGRLAVDQVNRLEALLHTAQSPLARALIPATEAVENALNMTGMTRVRLKGAGEWVMPDFVAQEFAQAAAPYRQLTGFHKQFRQFNSWWKTMATWLWPGFHIRNIMGAYFNNWLGGVGGGASGLEDYIQAGRILRASWEVSNQPRDKWRWANRTISSKDPQLLETFRKAGHKHLGGVQLDELTYGDLYAMQVDMGLMAGNGRAFAEPELGVEAAEREARGQRPIERLPVWAGGGLARTYVKGARGAGTLTENVFRTASFLRGMKTHGDLFEARAFTMMRHGDYADLTDTEYTWIRDLVPFYKWMRTNIPFQFHQLFENPGKLLAVYKAQDALLSDEQKFAMPEWMEQSFVIPIPGGKDGAFEAVMLDLPMSDLHVSGRELLSSMLPMARPLLESYIFEQQTYSGAPLKGKPVRLPAVFEPLAPVLDAVGLVQRGADGAPYTDDKTINVLSIIPPFSRARNWLFADPERAKLRVNTFTSSVLGLGVRPVDAEQLTDTELQFYYSQVLPQLEHLKDMGYQLPTTDDIQAMGQTTDTVLTNLGIPPETALVPQTTTVL